MTRSCVRVTTSLGPTTVLDAEVGPDSRPQGPTSPHPHRLGRYIPLTVLGAGGMGVVYAAYDTELARRVAVKVLPRCSGRHWSINAGPRLRREARALAQLAHPNVVSIYDVGEIDGTAFVAMELVEGQTLRSWQRARRRSWTEVVDAYVQAGEGLAAAHRHGLVHRDFKPDNAIIDPRGRVRVLDFGLAVAADPTRGSGHAVEPSLAPDVLERAVTISARLTATGAVMGTPAYMAPEQIAAAATDARTDQFSFCVALFEALYGERPFAGRTLEEIHDAIVAERVVDPPAADRAGRAVSSVPPVPPVPTWLRRIVLRGLRAQPRDRWPDMHALLRAIARGHQRGAWRRRAAAIGTGLLLTLGAALVAPHAIAAHDPCRPAADAVQQAWNADARAQVREAMLASPQPFAADTWSRVASGLDRYAAQWSSERHAVCEAGRRQLGTTTAWTTTVSPPAASRAAPSRRVACLDDRLTELAALVEVLADADDAVVARAASAVTRLPSIERCAQADLDDAPSRLDTIRATAVRTQLARAHAHELAGRYAEGRTLAQRAAHEADALGDTGLIASAQLRLGLLHERNGAYARAERAMTRATWMAVEGGHDEIAAQSMVQLAGIVGYLQARRDEGLAWGRHAAAAVERADADVYERARLYNNLGATHDRAGDLEAAREHYARALSLLRDADGELAQQERAATLNNLGNARARLGELSQAQADLEQAVTQTEALRGPHHPDVAIMLANLANIEHERGAWPRAELHHRRALAIRERALGPDHPLVASSLLNLGVTLTAMQQLEPARAHLERAVRLKRAALGPDHPETALALSNLGEALRPLGHTTRAADLHRRALTTLQDTLGDTHPLVAFAATNLGLDLLAQGRPAAAIDQLQRAIEIRERSDAPTALRGISRLALAQAIDALGTDPAHAHALAHAAWQDLADAPARYARERTQARTWLDTHPPA